MNTDDLEKLICELSNLIASNPNLPDREDRVDDLMTLVASYADLVNAREYAKCTDSEQHEPTT